MAAAAPVVVCTPSRGLVHSRTVAAVGAALAAAEQRGVAQRAPGPDGGWILSHDLPLPDAFTQVAALGLATGAAWLWFVEEDMVPPTLALVDLLRYAAADDLAICALDYPLPTAPVRNCAHHDPDGTVRWVGFGCTLIARAVFEALPAPWFRTDVSFIVERQGAGPTHLRETPVPPPYGGHDIYFCEAARQAGLRIGEVPPSLTVAGHLRLRSLGAAGSNQGAHQIAAVPPVERWS